MPAIETESQCLPSLLGGSGARQDVSWTQSRFARIGIIRRGRGLRPARTWPLMAKKYREQRAVCRNNRYGSGRGHRPAFRRMITTLPAGRGSQDVTFVPLQPFPPIAPGDSVSDSVPGAVAPSSAWSVIRRRCLHAALVVLVPLVASAQTKPPAPPADPDAPITFTETVIVTTPLPGVEQPARRVPAPVQTATDRDIDDSGALDLSDFLNRRMNGVYLIEVQNNPFQPDVNYRGYTASPLLGAP